MELREYRTVATFQRVLHFLDRHPVKPEPPLLSRMRDALTASMTRIEDLQQDQSKFTARIPVSELHKMRNDLRKRRMMPLVRIARPLLSFAPGAEKWMRVPHARTDTLTLANHAQQMCKLLAPHSKLLVDAGYSKTFVKEFRQEADTLAKAANNFEKARERRSAATVALKREFKKAMNTVTVIEGLMMTHYDPNLRRNKEWRRTRRIQSRIGRPPERFRKSVPASEPATASAGATPPS